MYEPTTIGMLLVVAQVLLPILVAVVTRISALPWVKATVLLALTAVTQIAGGLADGVAWRGLVFNTVVGFVIAVAAHFGLWKPTGATTAAGRIGV